MSVGIYRRETFLTDTRHTARHTAVGTPRAAGPRGALPVSTRVPEIDIEEIKRKSRYAIVVWLWARDECESERMIEISS